MESSIIKNNNLQLSRTSIKDGATHYYRFLILLKLQIMCNKHFLYKCMANGGKEIVSRSGIKASATDRIK